MLLSETHPTTPQIHHHKSNGEPIVYFSEKNININFLVGCQRGFPKKKKRQKNSPVPLRSWLRVRNDTTTAHYAPF